MSSSRKLKIFFFMLDAVGPQNACVGLGQVLHQRGHQIYFLTKTDDRLNGKFSHYGFKTLSLLQADAKELTPEEAFEEQKRETEGYKNMGTFECLPPKAKLKRIMEGFMTEEYFGLYANYDVLIRKWINELKPDLLVVDTLGVTPPSLTHSGIPWVTIYCSNPLGLFCHPDLPPGTSGLPIAGPREDWEDYRAAYIEHHDGNIIRGQQWLLKRCGYPTDEPPKMELVSPYLNIYQFPEELDYHDTVVLPERCQRVDSFCRTELGEPFQVPETLKSQMKPGDKLIYFSLGSVGTTNVPLMKRIIGILANTPHYYIVSKGVFHEEVGDLPANMWGDRYVPQTKILPIVDLAIIHGGNNSLTETFYFGTPFIVMPLFYDQIDNGQRAYEKGYGIRVDPFDFKDEELVAAIDKVLGDAELKAKMKRASERIRASQSKEKACDAIEQVVEEFYSKKQ